MKRSFNNAILEQLQKGVNTLEALKTVEDSGEFNEEEIQRWYDSFNRYKENKRDIDNCLNCGGIIAKSEDFCSDKCQQDYESDERGVR